MQSFCKLVRQASLCHLMRHTRYAPVHSSEGPQGGVMLHSATGTGFCIDFPSMSNNESCSFSEAVLAKALFPVLPLTIQGH